MVALRSFLADDGSVLLQIDVRPEQERQAARLLDAVAAEQDDLVMALEHSWTSAADLCAALSAELADAAARAREAFGEDELPRFAIPAPPAADASGLTLVQLLEHAESLHRSLSNHVRRLVFVLALRCDPSRVAECAAVMRQLVELTGTPDVKWVLFARAALVTEQTLRRRRRGPHAFDAAAPGAGLVALVQAPAERVHTLRRERAALRLIERELEARVIAGTAFIAVVVSGISYGNRMFFWTEAARSLSRQCAEIERSSSGGQHVAPLDAEAHEVVGHEEAEAHFAEFCERLTKAMLQDRGGLLVILAPSEATSVEGLAESIELLARSAASARVRYLIIDERLPAHVDEPREWRVSRLAFALGPEHIEQGVRERLAAPDCSPIERLRYTSALAAFAMAKDEPEAAVQHATDALELASLTGSPQEITNALYAMGNTLYQCAAFEQAAAAYAECVDRALDAGNPALAAHGMAGLGHTYFMREEAQPAIDAYTTARALWRKLGLRHGETYALTWLGEARARAGDHPAAIEHLDEALVLCRGVDPSQAEAYEGTVAELLQRKAAVHAKANQGDLERQCRAEAEKLHATAPVSDHP
jgi:tetratricopeptide (TPR) repeat protein